jgi:TatD DNase family protein
MPAAGLDLGGYTVRGKEASVGMLRENRIFLSQTRVHGLNGQVLFDSHNHLQSRKFGLSAGVLIGQMRDVGVTGCVVNSTREGDWEVVRALARDFPGFVRPAYGVHPWFADTVETGWQDRLREFLANDLSAGVGEIGVDGWVSAPSMEIQQDVFREQIRIAVGLDRPVTIHCLKAWGELFDEMDRADAWPKKFLMHSFGGSIEIAQRLLKHGAWFSFSGYFLQKRKAKVLEVFKHLPKDRILLETDAPDMMPPSDLVKFPLNEGVNHPANLRAIAEAFEKEMGEGTLEQMTENSKRFWGR